MPFVYGKSGVPLAEVEKFLSERSLELSRDRINCGGGNYGNIDVLGDIVRFSAENRWEGNLAQTQVIL